MEAEGQGEVRSGGCGPEATQHASWGWGLPQFTQARTGVWCAWSYLCHPQP